MKIFKKHIHAITPYFWEIPKAFHQRMRVPARILASEPLLDDIMEDRSLVQLVQVASLPGIQGASLVMPDVHEGYGFPIGGVAATLYPDGVISPGGIGYDINCGVRLMLSEEKIQNIRASMESLSKELYKEIPSGLGRGGQIVLTVSELDNVLREGAEWAVRNGYGSKSDLDYIESNGRLPLADPTKVSENAKKRGANQLGTIGSGNHFVEVDYVSEVYDKRIAEAFGLVKDQVVILIHTGSRGLGHQVATDYIKKIMTAMAEFGIDVPDRQLACVPLSSELGQDYFKAMCAAANYAWCNREVISWEVRNAWANLFGKESSLKLMYDVAHNIAKIETHTLNAHEGEVIVHRKGATRAFAPGNPELPDAYRAVGQPVIIPGSMGTSSYVLAGAPGSMEITFGSCCHGAGRRLSRTAAKKQVNAPVLKEELRERGIYVEAGSFRGLAEEAPIAYKDVNQVVETVHNSNVALKVAKLKPVAVIKG